MARCCFACFHEIEGCTCKSRAITNGVDDKTFYRVKPFDWALRHKGGTSYAIEEVRVVATSRNKDDAERLVERLNEWKKLKADNALLRSKLELRDIGKVELFRVENILTDEVEKVRQNWSPFYRRTNLPNLVRRVISRLDWRD